MTTADLAIHARTHDRRRVGEPLLVAAALALTYLIVAPASADLAAQVYRTDLFKEFGFTLWNGQWFAGHHTPGYSVLFPPLASVLGPRLVGALSAVAAAVLFERLTYPRWGSQARLGAIWFGAASATNLFTGRLTFALGVAIGLGALLAAQRERQTLAIGLAAVCSLASPIAGLFLALAGAAGWLASRRRVTLVMAASAFAVAAALAAAFPEGGVEPFVVSAYWPTVAFAVAVLVLVPREEKAIRYGAVLYALACTAAFLFDTPMGGNAARLGTLFGGPLLGLPAVAPARRGAGAAGAAAPLLAVDAPRARRARRERRSLGAGVLLPPPQHLPGPERVRRRRVEITHDAQPLGAVHVARRFSLARGWERQLDISTTGSSTSPAGPDRLPHLAVGQQRVSTWRSRRRVWTTPLSAAEARRSGLPYLVPVWGNADWRVYRYKYTVPLVSGPGASRLPEVQRDHPPRVGERRGRPAPPLHPLLELVAGAGCVEPAPGGLHPPSFSSAPAPCADRRIRARAAGEPGAALPNTTPA